ncbi:Holliday junction resolvase RuvX [Boudabousia tangfeifanii]|uniref:Holliday junction resolvase RuvX n=1 Tax=Boudabousia tangfeifanii TaxID=1912795 RepID=UPI0014785A0E|nr:Holliday junction resolvase RuvX [Boudabousia tangfeifanii]
MSPTRFAYDVGKSRIGAARAVSGTSVVLPITTYRVMPMEVHFDEILDDLETYQPEIIYVGLPLHLNGKAGISVEMAKEFAAKLQELYPQGTIRLIDERLTTATAHQHLAAAGISGKKRGGVVDQVAACVILEQAIAAEESTGELAGLPFDVKKNRREKK